MTTDQGWPTRTAVTRANALANSLEANERRRREPPPMDWNKAIANLLDVLDDNCDPDV
jgi:hypothetical protein